MVIFCGCDCCGMWFVGSVVILVLIFWVMVCFRFGWIILLCVLMMNYDGLFCYVVIVVCLVNVVVLMGFCVVVIMCVWVVGIFWVKLFVSVLVGSDR